MTFYSWSFDTGLTWWIWASKRFKLKPVSTSLPFCFVHKPKIDAEIAKIYDTFCCQLHTIKGIGRTLVAVILSEIGGDITKVESIANSCPCRTLSENRQSGKSIDSKGYLSKRGSPYLRRAIRLATFVATFKDPAIRKFYEHKISECKTHLKAMGQVCHKLISIIFAILSAIKRTYQLKFQLECSSLVSVSASY